jgi:hypothetical protein
MISFAAGIGLRRDGWANRDLIVGAIVALAPDLSAITKLLGVDETTACKALPGWGPGKFDATLFLDDKGFRPDAEMAMLRSSACALVRANVVVQFRTAFVPPSAESSN